MPSGFVPKRFRREDNSATEERFRQIEDFLARFQAVPTTVAPAAAAAPQRIGRIPESQVIFFDEGGHDHDANGTAVPMTGDVTGTNQATVVEQIQQIPVAAPVAGDDLQFLRFNNGAQTLTWETPGDTKTSVEEGGSIVVSDADSINFGAGFDVTDEGSGVAGVAMDLAEYGTGTPDSTTFLRGDQTWATPTGAAGKANLFQLVAATAVLANAAGTAASLFDLSGLNAAFAGNAILFPGGATDDNSAWWLVPIPRGANATPAVRVRLHAITAGFGGGGVVRFDVHLGVPVAGTVFGTEAMGAANNVNVTEGASANMYNVGDVTASNDDGFGPGEFVFIRVRRNSADAADTSTATAYLLGVDVDFDRA